jgi:hypothetical protein
MENQERITRLFEPPDRLATKEEAETFGLQFAEHWVESRP